MDEKKPLGKTRGRVLHVIPDLGIGGAERMLAQIATADAMLAAQETVVVSLLPGGHFAQQIRRAGIKVLEFNCRTLPAFVASLFKLARFISEFRPNVVQGWLYYGDFVALVARFLSRGRKNC